ncbi:MAG: hypothetical protein WCX08_01655 [Candidatus Buchananbacteria bacterium]
MNSQGQQFDDLEKAMLSVLAFFDIFNYPLTAVEIYKWLYQPQKPYQLFDVFSALAGDNLKGAIEYKNGFYYLTGREAIITSRLSRYHFAEKKFKIALKTVWWLRWLGFIRFIAVCNNAGYNNAAKDSDIDFFIVIKKGRLWYSRLIITLLVSVLGIRRHAKKIANRVCLSFYIADNHLNLADIALKPEDPYLIYWLAILAPIYDNGDYHRFFIANSWLRKYLPNFFQTNLSCRRRVFDSPAVKFFKALDETLLFGFIGNYLESLTRFFQLKKMQKKHNFSAGQTDTKIVINDSMLKFHENDKRLEYRVAWRERLTNLGL